MADQSNSWPRARLGALLIGLATVALAARQAPAATQYNLVMLNAAPFGSGEAYGIYNGQAAGAGFNGALYWPAPDTNVSLNPAGFIGSLAYGIWGTQQVGVAYDQQHQQHAVLWTGTAASVVNLSPTPSTVCYATATDGAQQVGVIAGPTAALWSGTAASYVSLNPANFGESTATGVVNGVQVGYGRYIGGEVALAWHGSANNVTILGPGRALGIAPNGQIVGVAENGTITAALWTSDTAASFVSMAPPNTSTSELVATNGTTQVGDADGRAGVWTGRAASFQPLPVPFGDTYSHAYAIDAQGNIAGVVGAGSSEGIPVIWQPVPEPSALTLAPALALIVRRG